MLPCHLGCLLGVLGCLQGNEAAKTSPRPSSPSTQACPMNTSGGNMRGRGWQCWGNPSRLRVPGFIRMIGKSSKPTRHKVVSKYQEALGEKCEGPQNIPRTSTSKQGNLNWKISQEICCIHFYSWSIFFREKDDPIVSHPRKNRFWHKSA